MDEYTDKIILYLDDELPPAEAAALETHMASCPACEAEFEALAKLDRLFASAPMVVPPANFVATFELKLEQRLNRRRTVAGAIIIGLLLAALLGLGTWYGVTQRVNLLDLSQIFHLVSFLTPLVGVAETFLKVLSLTASGLLALTRHPVFWGYITMAVGIISLWMQILRRVNLSQQPSMA